eukprot:COSAG01_NODE_50996_length_358_cov_1.204633_1_plen_47_part_10
MVRGLHYVEFKVMRSAGAAITVGLVPPDCSLEGRLGYTADASYGLDG